MGDTKTEIELPLFKKARETVGNDGVGGTFEHILERLNSLEKRIPEIDRVVNLFGDEYFNKDK